MNGTHSSLYQWLLFITFIASGQSDEPIVTVKQGALKGLTRELLDGSAYYSFRGIPYAQPPVGKLRFQAPLPPQPWTGFYNAKNYSQPCPQIHLSTLYLVEGSEDCLFLNIFTKSLEPNAMMPVMVFIHGGGYLSGSGDDEFYGPRHLVQQNVILVTINYRLEVLGFLSLDTPEVPGNAGMKDQVAALRWVQENIAQFGGDPNNVLIFGESAGAAAVTFHILSPMSRGLFQKAIVQSGVCLEKWFTGYDSKDRAFRLGKLLGKETDDVEELLQFLRNVPALDIANVTRALQTLDESYRYPAVNFAPVVEKRFENVEPFLTESPFEMLLTNKINEVPLIIGFTSEEGYLFLLERLKKIDVYNKDLHYLLPGDIVQNLSADNIIKFGERIKRFYVGDGKFGVETTNAVTDYIGDNYFIANTHRFAYFYKKRIGLTKPIYMYKFCCDTQLNMFKYWFKLQDKKGASHGDDIFYLFENMFNERTYANQNEARELVYMMTKLWTNFAKTGNPTPDNHLGVLWPQYTVDKKEFLNIDRKLTTGMYADRERIEFWNKLYCEANLPCMS